MRVTATKDVITLRFDPADLPAVSKIPCAFKNTLPLQNIRAYPATLAIALRIRKMFGDRAEWRDSGNWLEWAERWHIAKRMKAAEELPAIPGEVCESWLPQRQGFWFAFHSPGALLAHGMGLGKSKTILDVARVAQLRRALIVTTASAVNDWGVHLERHWPGSGTIPAVAVPLDQPSSRAKADTFSAIMAGADPDQFVFFVVSYDSVWRDPLAAAILAAKLDLAVLDESQHAQSFSGRRGIFVMSLGRSVRRRILASGTAMADSWVNLFSQYRFLDPGIFGYSANDYLARYGIFNVPEFVLSAPAANCEHCAAPALAAGAKVICARCGKERGKIRNPKPRFVVDVQRTDELHDLFHAFAHYAPHHVLNLPKPIEIDKFCKLSASAQRAYDEMEDECITVLDNGTLIEAKNFLSKFLRLEQMACGFVGENIIDADTGEVDATVWHHLDDAKKNLYADILAEIPEAEPIVVCCRYKHDVAAAIELTEKTGRKIYRQDGKAHQKNEWIAAAGGEALIGNIASMAEAMDLTRSRYFIVYSCGFSRGKYDQFVKRGDRPGQTREPFIIRMQAKGTIDERKFKAIAKKRDIIEEILSGMRADRK